MRTWEACCARRYVQQRRSRSAVISAPCAQRLLCLRTTAPSDHQHNAAAPLAVASLPPPLRADPCGPQGAGSRSEASEARQGLGRGSGRRIGAMAAGIIHTSYSSGYPSRSRQRNEEAPSGKLGGPGLWPKHARSHAEDRSWPRVRWRRLVRASGPAPVTDDGARLAARSRQR